MPYRGTLTLDFGNGQVASAFQRMETALLQLGWTYAETSAFVYDQPDDQSDATALIKSWQGIAVVGRATNSIGGRLSAMSYTTRFLDPSESARTQFGQWQPENAYNHFRIQTFPGDMQLGQTGD